MKYTKALTILGICSLMANIAGAATIEYRMLIDGNASPSQALVGGTHTLTVEGRVADNELAPSTPGGFIQASFDLMGGPGLTFVQGTGFLGAPNGLWDSTTNAEFANHNAGAIDAAGNVIQETGSILPSAWNTKFNAVGAGDFSFIASGPFEYDGTSLVDLVLKSSAGVNLVAALNGANVGSRIPDGANDTVVGANIVIGIPEPASIALLGCCLVGLAGVRRRM